MMSGLEVSDPDDARNSTVIWSMWMMTAVSFFFICARFYTRMIIVRSVGWDDWVVLFSWLLNVTFAAVCTAAAKAGMGTHMDLLSPEDTVQTMKMTTIAQTVGITVASTVKLSLGLFLLRIVIKPWHKAMLWTSMAIVMFMGILTAICLWLQKTPVESIYNPGVEGTVRLNQTTLSLVTSSIWIVSDFFYVGFPWLFMWQLQMKVKEKTTILCGLSLGILAGVCGIVRTIQLGKLASQDFTYDIVDPIIWTAGEFCVTLICNSIVVLFPLYRVVTGADNTENSGGYSGGYSNKIPDSSGHHMSGWRRSLSKDSNSEPYGQSHLGERNKTRGVTTTKVGLDNSSDESILRSERRNESNGIKRTWEVTVDYGDAESEHRATK